MPVDMDALHKKFSHNIRQYSRGEMLKGHAKRHMPPQHVPPATPVGTDEMPAEPDADDQNRMR